MQNLDRSLEDFFRSSRREDRQQAPRLPIVLDQGTRAFLVRVHAYPDWFGMIVITLEECDTTQVADPLHLGWAGRNVVDVLAF